jgi:hypothetical protein
VGEQLGTDLWRESPPGARLAEWCHGRGLDATEIAQELDLAGFTPDERHAAVWCAMARRSSRLSAESPWAPRRTVASA